MHAHWQEWLNRPGVEVAGDQIMTTPETDSETRSVPLTGYGIIRVSGPDAHKFLQGQLSCDLAEVDRAGHLPGAHCNIKGHIHSLYQVIYAAENTYWLRTRLDLIDDALTLLKKYIIFSRAEAELATDLLGVGLCGPDSQALASGLKVDGSVAIAHSDRLAELWLPAPHLDDTLDALQPDAPLGTSNAWELEAVNAAIPELYPATREAFIPQMINLQEFKGVSFSKGCYTGQEIVTRLQHRGQLKRPMYLAEVITEQAPAPGDALASDNKSNAGQIVRVAQTDNSTYRVLAVAIKSEAEESTLHLDDEQGPALSLLSLPYSLDPSLFVSKR